MSKVFSAHAVSVDGFISGRTPEGDEEFGRGLGDAPMLFDWYFYGDTPILLGGGRSFFQQLPEHVPGVTHPHYEVIR